MRNTAEIAACGASGLACRGQNPMNNVKSPIKAPGSRPHAEAYLNPPNAPQTTLQCGTSSAVLRCTATPLWAAFRFATDGRRIERVEATMRLRNFFAAFHRRRSLLQILMASLPNRRANLSTRIAT